MGFAFPAALALLSLSIPILLLYLLRLRREERVVSSVYLWQQARRDLEANAPWQRLRRNLLLFLQLAALVALVLALAGPYLQSLRLQGTDLIAIVDASASMAATDLSPNRLVAARREVLHLAAGLPPQGRVTLIAAGETPQVLLAHSADRALLRTALEGIRPTATRSDLGPALHLAATLAAESPRAEVVLLSDGQVHLPEAMTLPAAFRFIPLGESEHNQGLIACSLEEAAGGLSLFVRVRNFAPAPVQRRLDLYVDGALLTARHIVLPVQGDLDMVLPLEGTVGSVEARLDGQDDLPIDDVAWAVPPRGRATEIVLVSEGNRFLQTGLGLLPGIELAQVSPQAFPTWWASTQEAGAPPALLLLDAFVPPALPPENLLLIAPPTSTVLFGVEGVLESPRLRPVRQDDPLLRYVDVAEIGVRRSLALAPAEWARPVLQDEKSGRPILLIGEVEGRRVAVLAFDLHDSDLPLQVAFPVLLNNLVEALVPGGGGSLPSSLPPGAPLTIEAPPHVERVVVRRPDGGERSLTPTGGRAVFEQTGQAGVYEVSWQSQGQEWDRARVAVSLLSPGEGQIAPRSTLPAPVTSTEEGEQPESAGRLPFDPYLIGLALALLLVEWGIAHRGGWPWA